VLITDHNVRETLDICDRAYIISEGLCHRRRSPDEVLRNAKVRAVYLGDDFRSDARRPDLEPPLRMRSLAVRKARTTAGGCVTKSSGDGAGTCTGRCASALPDQNLG
jgi:ABC-type multidrug transport system ATPase subunit